MKPALARSSASAAGLGALCRNEPRRIWFLGKSKSAFAKIPVCGGEVRGKACKVPFKRTHMITRAKDH
eukprot:scaffold151730_cov20-Tisochrysis_lutea.AAC.4